MIYVIFETLNLAALAAPIMGNNIERVQPGTDRWDLYYIIFYDDTVVMTTWCTDQEQLEGCMEGVTDWQIYTGNFDNVATRYQAIPYPKTQEI